NVKALAKTCVLVWLWASPDETLRRVGREKHRPLLNVMGKKEKISGLLNERIPKYAACADLVIGTQGMLPTEVAKLVIEETKLNGK
ncbi:MAG TPA: shikimate kinase, partial [Candidatus Micrarchaeota archaeon]|nr:shikimate kinase [Candidatus Micrarchaeota archaeon]